jgi:hypothetical protein
MSFGQRRSRLCGHGTVANRGPYRKNLLSCHYLLNNEVKGGYKSFRVFGANVDALHMVNCVMPVNTWKKHKLIGNMLVAGLKKTVN